MATVDESHIPPTDFLRTFQQVMVDPSGTVNILAGWEEGEIAMLRHHARETLAMLEEGRDLFAETFLRDRKLGLATYDEVVRSVEIRVAEFPLI